MKDILHLTLRDVRHATQNVMACIVLFGLVVIMPILGHASWHAYRDLVE